MANSYRLDQLRIDPPSNSHRLDQLLIDPPSDFVFEAVSHLEYQLMPDSRKSDSPNTSNFGNMPYNITSSISSLDSTMSIQNYFSPEAESEYFLNHWNESQILFNQDQSEGQVPSHDGLELDMIQADLYSPSPLFKAPGNLRSSGFSNEFSPQSIFPEAYYFSAGMPESWNCPTPAITPPSSTNSGFGCFREPTEMPERSRSPAAPSPSTTYSCEICAKPYPKKYLLNGHKKLHDKPITCPVQRCPHRTAKTRDMERHVIAQHPDYVKTQALPTPPRPMCPVAGCRYGQRGFARKDHLRRHLQKTHPGWLTQKVEGS